MRTLDENINMLMLAAVISIIFRFDVRSINIPFLDREPTFIWEA